MVLKRRKQVRHEAMAEAGQYQELMTYTVGLLMSGYIRLGDALHSVKLIVEFVAHQTDRSGSRAREDRMLLELFVGNAL